MTLFINHILFNIMAKVVFFLVFGMIVISACSPTRWYLVNSSGIATYNHRTGQLEVLWEWAEKPNTMATDTLHQKVHRLH